MSHGTIYKAINVKTNKSYVGKTAQKFWRRKSQHKMNALTNNFQSHFHRAIRKHGWDSFEWEILFEGECSNNKLNDLEIFYIGYYDTFNNGYNLTIGGEGGLSGRDCHFSSEKMSKDQRNKIQVKIRKTMINTIDPETGLNLYEKAGLKAKETKINTIDPETGLNLYEKAGKIRQNTRNLWGEEKKKEFSDKMKMIYEKTSNGKKKEFSDKMKEVSVSGSDSHLSKKFLLIAPNGQKIGCSGNILKMCDKYNISYDIIKKNYNKGKIIVKRKSSEKSINTEGWEAIIINQ